MPGWMPSFAIYDNAEGKSPSEPTSFCPLARWRPWFEPCARWMQMIVFLHRTKRKQSQSMRVIPCDAGRGAPPRVGPLPPRAVRSRSVKLRPPKLPGYSSVLPFVHVFPPSLTLAILLSFVPARPPSFMRVSAPGDAITRPAGGRDVQGSDFTNDSAVTRMQRP